MAVQGKQSIVLTGGLGLLGRAFAKSLNENGYHVIVVDIQETLYKSGHDYY